jgi:uncharacterized protein YjcR
MNPIRQKYALHLYGWSSNTIESHKSWLTKDGGSTGDAVVSKESKQFVANQDIKVNSDLQKPTTETTSQPMAWKNALHQAGEHPTVP